MSIEFLSNKNKNSSVKSELLFSDKLNNSINLNKFTSVLIACELFGSIFIDFFKYAKDFLNSPTS